MKYSLALLVLFGPFLLGNSVMASAEGPPPRQSQPPENTMSPPDDTSDINEADQNKSPPDGLPPDGDVKMEENNGEKIDEIKERQVNSRVKKVMFGTKNGYDAGGTDPLCWISPFSKVNETTIMSTIHNEIELLNEQLFEAADSTELLPECPPGTNMTVTPRNLDPDTMEMLLGEPYDFLVELTFDTSKIYQRIITPEAIMSVHYRLHVCDAVRKGFCNPILDTRDQDASLTRQEADLVPEDAPEFPDTEEKWAYTEGTALQGLLEEDNNNDTSTMYGRWCKWKLREQPGTGIFTSKFNVKLQLPVPEETVWGAPKPYFFIAQAVMQLNVSTKAGLRVDVSQSIPSKVVYLKPPPKIMTVSRGTKIYLGLLIGVIGMFGAVCFAVIVVKRKHSVMRLAQGSFLATMAAACFLQTVFSFAYIPSRDIHCRLSGPLVFIPLTLVGAILVGRVWRIYSTLSNVNSLGSHQQAHNKSLVEVALVKCLDLLAGLPICFGKCSKDSPRHAKNSFRRIVTPQETAGLIVLLSLPQVILQIVASTVFGAGLETQLSMLGSGGRVVCSDDNQWTIMAGTGYASFVFVLAVLMAWFSRDLPSAFNEKDQIFNAATIGTLISAMSIGLGEMIDQPTTSPDAVVVLQSSVSIGIAASVLVLIIWPKVSRVLSGEKVVVSKMLGSRYSIKQSSAGTRPNSEVSQMDHNTASFTFTLPSDGTSTTRKRIQVQKDDPVPSRIETQIFEVQGVLRSVMNKCGDGRTLTEDDWEKLRSDVGKLNADLDLVDLDDGTVERAPSLA